MKTLKELLEGVELPVRIYNFKWKKGKYFDVVDMNDVGCLGYTKENLPEALVFEYYIERDWSFYTEPKPKETWYEYLIKSMTGLLYNEWHKSDDKFLKSNPNQPIIKTGRSIELEQGE